MSVLSRLPRLQRLDDRRVDAWEAGEAEDFARATEKAKEKEEEEERKREEEESTSLRGRLARKCKEWKRRRREGRREGTVSRRRRREREEREEEGRRSLMREAEVLM